MNIALYGKYVPDDLLPSIGEMLDVLHRLGGRIMIYEPLFRSLDGRTGIPGEPFLFTLNVEIAGKTDFLFSIGGDGTILEAVRLVGESGIPVAGINLGRLGFLSGISRDRILPAMEAIRNGQYRIESRTLLELVSPGDLFDGNNIALNDLTVYKPNVMTMLTIRTWINGEMLNAYWADGLIVATPTGSTAYSLSCTGPIITPDTEAFLITPIASHNLTVRPIVIRDDAEIMIRVEGKTPEYHVSLDSRIVTLDRPLELVIRKASFRINLLRLTDKNFFQTIREKLNWGLDNRNY